MKNIVLKIKQKGIKGTLNAFKNRLFCIDDRLWIKLFKNKLKPNCNYILFQSEGDFSDNARVLFEHMVDTYGDKYRYIWLVKEPTKYPPKYPQYNNTKFISTNVRFLFGQKVMWYYAYKCKYLFFTHPSWFDCKSSDQTVINLWHGCGYKASKGAKYKEGSLDYCLVTGPFYQKIHSEIFNCKEEDVLPIGFPRNDLLFKQNHVAKDFLRKLVENTNQSKVIIWMPTFRKSSSSHISDDTILNQTGLPIFETIKSLDTFNSFLIDKNIKLVLKLHHLQDVTAIKANDYKNIKIVKDYDLNVKDIQLYEILGYTDALITDYSSVAIDYLLLDRPIAFTLDDYDNYLKSRGFVMEDPLAIMPGKKIYNIKDFYDFIIEIHDETDDFKIDRERVNKLVNIRSKNYSKGLLDYLNI